MRAERALVCPRTNAFRKQHAEARAGGYGWRSSPLVDSPISENPERTGSLPKPPLDKPTSAAQESRTQAARRLAAVPPEVLAEFPPA